MIWSATIIIAIVIIFILIARRIPLAKNFLKNEEPETTPEQMTTFALISNADDAYEKKKFLRAEELYLQAAIAEPTNCKIYNRLGAIYLEQKNYYDAKESFLQSVKIDPDKAPHHINLGLAYLGLKDYYKAEQSFSEALKLDPNNQKYQDLLQKAKDKK